MKRRTFILSLLSIIPSHSLLRFNNSDNQVNNSEIIFNKIIQKAKKNNWKSKTIGDLIIEIAKEFINTPYVAYTLEGDTEICRINLEGLDCVTFYENALSMARLLKKGYSSYDKLIEEVTFIRYRNGIIEDYTSRLHYTSEWILDNIKKGVISDITKKLGGNSIRFNLSFMSQNPQFYKSLNDNPEFIKSIKKIEQEINNIEFYFIPTSKVKLIQDKLANGDIIAIVTNKKGLDYSHTGLVYKKQNKSYLLHASSKLGRVLIDKQLSDYLKNSKNSIGITVLRPLEV